MTYCHIVVVGYIMLYPMLDETPGYHHPLILPHYIIPLYTHHIPIIDPWQVMENSSSMSCQIPPFETGYAGQSCCGKSQSSCHLYFLKKTSAGFWNPKQVSTVKWLWVKTHLCSSIQIYVSYCRYYPYITMRYPYSHRMTASCS